MSLLRNAVNMVVVSDRYAVGGDAQAARAGSWGWLAVGEDSVPELIVDVLIAYRSIDERGRMCNTIEVTVGFRNRHDQYFCSWNGEAITHPVGWMPIPCVAPLERVR